MTARAYTATVRIDNGEILPAVFVVADTESAQDALSRALDAPEYDWLGEHAFWALDALTWLVVRSGQNTGRGFRVDRDQPITKLIEKKETV